MPGQDYWRYCRTCEKNTPHKPVESIKNHLMQLYGKHKKVEEKCMWCGEIQK